MHSQPYNIIILLLIMKQYPYLANAYYEAMHHFMHTGFMAHAVCGTAVGWFPDTGDKVEDGALGWRDRGRDEHLARF